jgi:23S rRNA (guanosine2251-2'-O)-methyltransferase
VKRRQQPKDKRAPRGRRGSAQPGPRETEHLHGIHCVLEALRAGRRSLIRLSIVPGAEERPEVAEALELAHGAGIPLGNISREDLGAGETKNPQGIVLEAGRLPEVGLEELCRPRPGGRRIVALDGVEDPQNVGALARVAEGSGACGLVLTKRRSPPLSPALARASAGAIEWLPVARVGNLSRTILGLKDEGFWVVGADPMAPEGLYEMRDELLHGDLVVVLGAEGRGLRPEIKKLVDHPVSIPMKGRVASLNVSAAGAVLLYELLRRAALAPAQP